MRVLAITHGESVGPGVFGDVVRAAGHRLEEWSAPHGGDPPDADALMVFGGGMHVDQEDRHPWLTRELRHLERALAAGTPAFGVCLGGQLLARAAGARVGPSPAAEVGWTEVELTGAGLDDPVLSALPPRFEAFQWHHYAFDVPAGGVELARNAVCAQAFRVGSAWGIQFHAELTAGMASAWLREDPDDVADADAFAAETARRLPAWNELGRALCAAFLRAAG